jgi:DNA invertase Pin-like site-specific DNA recombinase
MTQTTPAANAADTTPTPGAGVLVGYARVSTADQNTDAQLTALHAAGCVRVFTESASGALRQRPELAAALDYIRPGDVLVVTKLDRLGRSLSHLIDTIHSLADRGVGFRSLGEAIDTTTPTGRLLLHVIGAIAEFERDIIRERTRESLAEARRQGRTGGRPSKITPGKVEAARALIDAGRSVTEAAAAVGVGRATLYRALTPHPGAETASAAA